MIAGEHKRMAISGQWSLSSVLVFPYLDVISAL